jgi:predicted AAA+ superfamily ATPase
MKKLQPISNDLIIDRMKFENPWWLHNHIDAEYNGMRRRLYFDLFHKLVTETNPRRAVVLMGPRRIGKTVLMHHAIEQLLADKIPADNIAFINVENPLYLNFGLEQLFKLSQVASGNEETKGYYVFFDEIQYLKDWEIHLKVLVDSYPNTKFIVSGSAAAALKLKSVESGAGRFTDFMLPPLTFHEYICLKGFDNLIKEKKIKWRGEDQKVLSTTNINELNKHFIDYINFGGYPEVIFSDRIQANLGRYIKSDIVDKVLLRDLPSLYGIQNVQELNHFFTNLAYYTGNELSLTTLSTNSNVNVETLKKYIEYLEAAFLIKQIHRIDDCGKKFKRTTIYKIYLTNPSLRSALFSPVSPSEDDMFGHIVETAIYAQWFHRDGIQPMSANWGKGEVDMVFLNKKLKPAAAVEIKWSNKFFENPASLKSLLTFCKKNKVTDVVVTTIDKEGTKEADGIMLHFQPSATYALTVGYNTINQKNI